MAFIDRMTAQNYIDKTREYLNYLEEHIEYVRKAFIEVSNACDGMAWVGDDYTWHGIRCQVENHDLSKLGKEEFTQYRDSFYPVDGTKTKTGHVAVNFNEAWENHKKENHHHHETVENYNDLVHMVVDWTAMGYKFGDTAQSFYEKTKKEGKIKLSIDHETFINEIFHRIKLFRES